MRNLIELLKSRSLLSDKGITFIESGGREAFLSYKALYDYAIRGANFLVRKGLQRGDELILHLEDNKTFIITFWACILGGIIPVPMAIGNNDDRRKKLFTVSEVLRNPWLITSAEWRNKLAEFAERKGWMAVWDGLTNKVLDETDLLLSEVTNVCGSQAHEQRWTPEAFSVNETDIAFIQFSSGSTGNPKGVVLSHQNLLTNIAAISIAAEYSGNDSTMSWMPLTHDMGLIGFHLNPLFSGINQYILPTQLFIRRPALWLEKAGAHKVTILCSPNFGYEYVLKHTDWANTHEWDLSAVRILYNGAEPIAEKICLAFLHHLAQYGLRPNAMCPVYGLAEASLAVTMSRWNETICSISLDRDQLNIGQEMLPAASPDKQVTLINVGRPVSDCRVRIAGDKDVPVGEGVIGQIQIQGKNTSPGYYNNEAATENARTADQWWRTGDLGFMKDGDLYVTGRLKDLMFAGGQNYYPHDIEQVAGELDGIALNKLAVAGYFNDQTQKEESIAFILHRGDIAKLVPLAASLRPFIISRTGLELDRVVPVTEIPKTTSGKLQRFRLVEDYRQGLFKEAEETLLHMMAAMTSDSPEMLLLSPLEQQLLEIWKSVLRLPVININDSFFNIGGNSLKAAEVAMAVQKAFAAELPLTTFYKYPSIRQLAAIVPALRPKEYLPVDITPLRDYYPASSAQRRLYYAWAKDEQSVAYNLPVAFTLNGIIDANRLEAAIQQLINRHDVLRMAFRLGTQPEFKIKDHIDFSLEQLLATPSNLNNTLKGLVQPFDLAAPPLFRIKLIMVAENDYSQPAGTILLIDFHHIISDGLSVYHFMEELVDVYEGLPLPPPPLPYRAYVDWESNHWEKMKERAAWWLEQWQGKWPVLEMPVDCQRPAIFSGQGERLPFSFTADTAKRLRELAKTLDCSLHVLLFTLYNILLSRYSGQQDLVVGISVAGRTHPDFQRTLGLFVNNLAVRSCINSDDAFTTLLEKEKQLIATALDNQDYPFEELVAQTTLKREISRNPVFDTMFIYQNMGLPAKNNRQLNFDWYDFDAGYSKFDLSIEVFDDNQALHYTIEYATRLFHQSTIGQLQKHFDNLVNAALEQPGARIADLKMLADTEYEQYMQVFNNTERAYPHDKTIIQLFTEQVARTPDCIAVEQDTQRLTYRELNTRANEVASLLQEKGITQNQVVALLMPRSVEWITGVLGILKVGGCYLPVDTDWPEERIKWVLEDSGCVALITSGEAARLGALNIPVIDILEPVSGTSTLILSGVGPQNPAYILYTSGSTGRPKGVMIGHRSLVNYCCWAASEYCQDTPMAFPFFTAVSFDLTVTSIFVPLITGGTVVVYVEKGQGLLIEKVLLDDKVDCIKLTPAHLRMVADSLVFRPAAGHRLKALIVGGEQLSTLLAQRVSAIFGEHIKIFNEYGPTEATVGCMIHRYQSGENLAVVPIGVPAANTRIYLLDNYLQPVPAGVDGELYISGDGVALGYRSNEKETARKFLPDPFVSGERMYKTGDIARRLKSGWLVFIGRVDLQVKINGYRIELPEIEYQLLGYKGVTGAIATVLTGKHGQQHIYAYYTGTSIPEETPLRAFLAERLPHYMMPLQFIWLEEIPLTPNGKVDYAALPEPRIANREREVFHPGNRVEEICLKVWMDVLREPAIGVTDNFFELGGDSIKAIQISARLQEEGIAVNVNDILTWHTVRQISQHAVVRTGSNGYQQGRVAGEKKLTPIESWFFSNRFAVPGYFNQSLLLRMNQVTDVILLQTAFTALVRHHDGLRLNYDPAKGGLFYNEKHFENEFDLNVVKIDGREGASDLRSVCQCLKEGFDISDSLLLKAAIIKDTPGNDMLFITAHHLVTDGISWRILLEDLYTAYRALENGKSIVLPYKTASLSDWAKALSAYAVAEGLDREKAYWKDIEDTGFVLPQDSEPGCWLTRQQRSVSGLLDRQTTDYLLKEAHHAFNTDVPILLNTALVLALQKWTGHTKLLVWQESHGRHLPLENASRTVGWFTNLYPVKLEWKPGLLSEQILAVKEQLRKVPHHGMGYGFCRAGAMIPAPLANRPTAIRLNYLGQFDRELDNEWFSFLSNTDTGSDISPENQLTCQLELNCMILKQGLTLTIHYNGLAYSHETVKTFLDSYFHQLEILLSFIRAQNEIQFSPSDFDSASLSVEDLQQLFG